MRRILAKLDELADTLEAQGAVKEAQKVDSISNSIEAGMLNKLDDFINKGLAKIGIKRIPTPLDAAKALVRAPNPVLDSLAGVIEDILKGPYGPLSLVPAVKSSSEEAEAAETATRTQGQGGIPSELERLNSSEKRLIPAYMSILKSMTGKGVTGIPGPEKVREEIDRLIGEVSGTKSS